VLRIPTVIVLKIRSQQSPPPGTQAPDRIEPAEIAPHRQNLSIGQLRCMVAFDVFPRSFPQRRPAVNALCNRVPDVALGRWHRRAGSLRRSACIVFPGLSFCMNWSVRRQPCSRPREIFAFGVPHIHSGQQYRGFHGSFTGTIPPLPSRAKR